MSSTEIEIVAINIIGREFKIKCPQDMVAKLKQAAEYLNTKMYKIQQGDKFATLDHVAITAALNIVHELLLEKQQRQEQENDVAAWTKQALELQQKIEQLLASEN